VKQSTPNLRLPDCFGASFPTKAEGGTFGAGERTSIGAQKKSNAIASELQLVTEEVFVAEKALPSLD